MGVDSYFDYNGSTPVDRSVAELCVEWMLGGYGNAAGSHPEGRKAREAIDRARGQIALGIGARADEIWFTSGGTESNNWALVGTSIGRPNANVSVSAIEHKSVLQTAESLRLGGRRVSVVGVDASGRLDLDALERTLESDTRLVSVMLANNETGVIQPIRDVSALCRRRGILLHCDAVCSIGKIPVDVDDLGCDLLSLSSHKLYAPKGVGVLYVRSGVRIEPLIHGCGQQCGLRGGSENTTGAVAFGAAVESMQRGEFRAATNLELLRDELWNRIRVLAPDAIRNGAGALLPNTLSVAFSGCSSVHLQEQLGRRGFSVAVGAAAASGAPSHVLKAMGASDDRARATLRFSLGRFTSRASIDALLEALVEVLPRCRVAEMST